MPVLTNQAVTSVPVPADMNWTLMENHALVRNMNESIILNFLHVKIFLSDQCCVLSCSLDKV